MLSNKPRVSRRAPTKLRQVGRAPANPPTFDASIAFSHRFRFESSAALARVPVTDKDLLDLLVMATSATLAYELCSAVRLRSVKIWGPMASSLTPVTAAIEYNSINSVGAPSDVRSNTSMGAMKAAALSYSPPAQSLASFWQNGRDTASPVTLFYLTGPANAVVDIGLDLRIQNGQEQTSAGGAVAGATTGAVYCRALDSNGSSLLVPVSYPTI